MSFAAAAPGINAVDLKPLVYKREGTLFAIHVVIATVFWLALIVVTVGLALVWILFLFVIYLFVHSGLIAWLRGNGVRITPEQFPDLHASYVHCGGALGVAPAPDAYIINGGGILNAFATRFLGRNFVVLYSNIVDAMAQKPEAIRFYIGHELGHIRRNHLLWHPFISPASILPLLGAGYSRAREYTCDAFGNACCADTESAIRGLVALAAGERRWQALDVPAYLEQTRETGGFWMSFHELIADYPWLVKRAARLAGPDTRVPSRNPLAWLLALFVPRIGVGGGAGGLVVIAIIGILAAIAIPAYQDYTIRANMVGAVAIGRQAADMVGAYYDQKKAIPASLAETGFAATSPAVRQISVDPKSGVVRVTMAIPQLDGKSLLYMPSLDENKRIRWRCGSDDIPPKYLPAVCRP